MKELVEKLASLSMKDTVILMKELCTRLDISFDSLMSGSNMERDNLNLSDESNTEELSSKNTYSVKLELVNGVEGLTKIQKVSLIKFIKEIKDSSLSVAKEIMDSCPCTLKDSLDDLEKVELEKSISDKFNEESLNNISFTFNKN